MKKYRLAALITVVLLLVAAVWDLTTYRYRLSGISEAVQQGETLYLLDNQGDSYQVFQTDREGTIHGRIDLQKLDGVWLYSYGSLTVDGNGGVYLYGYGQTLDGSASRTTVYRCDFEAGELTPCWELPAAEPVQIQVTGGQVYYAAADGERAAFYSRNENGQEKRRLKTGMENGQIKAFTWRQDKGFLWADWSGKFYRNNRLLNGGRDVDRDYANLCVNENGIFYTDLKAQAVFCRDWEDTEARMLYPISAVKILDGELEYSDLLPVSYDKDGGFLAGVEVDADNRCLGKFDRSGNQIWQLTHLVKPYLARLFTAGKAACAGAAVLLVLFFLGKLLFYFTKGTVPILLKIPATLVPILLAVGAVSLFGIRGTLENRIVKMNYDLLYGIADQWLKSHDPQQLERIDSLNLPGDAVFYSQYREQEEHEPKANLYLPGEDTKDPVVLRTECRVFLEDEGELRSLQAAGRRRYGTQVLYERGWDELEKMREAMERQVVIKTEYNDFSGNYVALYVPVLTADGRSIGVLECGLDRRILTYEIREQMGQITRIFCFLLAFAVLFSMLVLGFYLRYLALVKQAVEEVSQGNLELEVPVRGRDEVTGIARAFNQMTAQLKERMDFIRQSMERYSAFVPKQAFEILDKRDITETQLGDQKEIEAAILNLTSHQFHTVARQRKGTRLFGMVNIMLQEVIPVIAARHGVIEQMAGDRVSSFYPGGSRDALICAISICENGNWMEAQGGRLPPYWAVIHYGTIRVGIVGEEERMAVITISEISTLASFLEGMGEKYGIRILITESAVKQIPDFSDRFHSRMLGYIHLRRDQDLEAVYDVYDGDTTSVRQLKEETKTLFEQALSDYFRQEYYDARLKFAQVLRKNPQDLTARTYVYRCDTYCQSGETKGMDVWLEEY